jgi:hypothetical protein
VSKEQETDVLTSMAGGDGCPISISRREREIKKFKGMLKVGPN